LPSSCWKHRRKQEFSRRLRNSPRPLTRIPKAGEEAKEAASLSGENSSKEVKEGDRGLFNPTFNPNSRSSGEHHQLTISAKVSLISTRLVIKGLSKGHHNLHKIQAEAGAAGSPGAHEGPAAV